MFTGIVECKGTVDRIEHLEDAARIRIHAPEVLGDAHLGDSISVAGVCLTVANKTAEHFEADVMQESLNRSSLGQLEVGDEVNLERAMAANGRFGGHVVQGHVDGTSELIERSSSEHWDVLRFRLPAALKRYVVEKGSICVSGTSLTVSGISAETDPCADGWFEVSLIPTTLEATTLGTLAVSEPVNIEVDVMAKYVERMAMLNPDQSPEHPCS
ncbi:riboflavin synthase [Corynebacterium pseudopelargi]|uniref:Riboflavin synthase n=1 Tax=Corynebacterium pseudopelargi TaxID=2080757 RepID=A0A3G6IU97_9CORY|nr:riboflavin synthase [Corynebacterium pseudopelargi]AZA09203.1 Riboflavin synthase [Corynebacterium pseudopelargi]